MTEQWRWCLALIVMLLPAFAFAEMAARVVFATGGGATVSGVVAFKR